MAQDDGELANTDAFMDWVCKRHPGEDEYHQAIRGVAAHVLDIARENPAYRDQRVLQRLTEPDRSISFRVVWVDDEDRPRINRGYRIQQTNAIGPYKGGLRFDPSVNSSILKFLAFEQIFKNSLTGLSLGAGKGGADLDPRGLSDAEIMRFCQSFMTELYRHIGPLTDVPAGDIGVGQREIGYLFGQYKRLENRFSASMTGKSLGFGGSHLRQEATGYGAVYFLCWMLGAADKDIDGQRLAISGAGNVALHAARKAVMMDARVVTLSNRAGLLYKQDSLSADDVETVARQYASNGDLSAVAESIDADWIDEGKPWEVECDVAVPSATQNELDADDARQLVDNGCAFVVEAANMPLTEEAKAVFAEAGVPIAPGKAANAGGVAVSGLEMAQNNVGQSWSEERLDEALRDIVRDIFRQSCREGEAEGRIDYCRGADRAGFRRVADAVAAFGAM